MPKKITLKEIAKKCGVSTATVSFVINNKNRKGISPTTWTKIETVLLKFGYKKTRIK
jgi:LacI family transcriptional regulator